MSKLKLRYAFINLIFVLLLLSAPALAQSTTFTYQGQLSDNNALANGQYDFQFKLFDTATVGTGVQQGGNVTVSNVTVTAGVFTVQLDFGACASCFNGANRFLEIAVKPNSGGSFTTLAPRSQITTSPYSLRTLSAAAADSLSAACVSCVADANIGGLSGSKVTGAVASATSATTAGNVSGIVAVANGGTGAANAANARTNLGLGTLATVTPTGSASSTTFLRGDSTWAAPAANNTFFNQLSNPSATTANFFALSGGNAQPLLGSVANLMTGSCMVDGLFVAGTITANAASDTLTFTLVKNGSTQALTTTIAVSVLNTTVTNSDTTVGHAFPVAAGDAVAIQITQTNGSPTVRLATSVRCR